MSKRWFAHTFRAATGVADWLNERQRDARIDEVVVVTTTFCPVGEILLIGYLIEVA